MNGRSLAFWAVLPLVVPQALALRRRALRLPPAAGPTSGTIGDGRSPYLLVGVGDSIIAGVGAATHERGLVGQAARALADRLDRSVRWESIGRRGLDARRVREQLVPTIPAATVDGFVVSVGVNDVLGLTKRSSWRHHLEALVADLERHSPRAVIVLCGLPPLGQFPLLPQPLRAVLGLRAGLLDGVMARVARVHSTVRHLPVEIEATSGAFCADGFHPSEAGYIDFGNSAAQRLLNGGTGRLRPPSRP